MSVRTVNFLLSHPLSRQNKPKAFGRFISWQMWSRLIGKPKVYNFVNQSQLIVYPGMTGATGNVYAGLHEFEDMSFVLHSLRHGDVFVDIGANVGSYTVLAGSAVGANCISIEPVPSTFTHLVENVELNGIQDKVELLNIGLGKQDGILRFSADEDTKNHVISGTEINKDCIEVAVRRLDDILPEQLPTVIKMDVEGWETQVIAGASNVLCRQGPTAMLMEFGCGERYGFDESALFRKILDYGFEVAEYCPFDRKLTLSMHDEREMGNILFVKGIDYFRQRVETAPEFKTLGISI